MGATMSDEIEKYRTWEALAEEVESWKAEGRRVVFTNGCFDLFHAGHARYLSDARGEGDLLVVGVNSDASLRRLKGEGRPLVPEGDRLYVLSALACVDRVTLFDEDTPQNLISLLVPHVLVKGADYRNEEVVGAEVVEGAGGRVALMPLLEGRSSSDLIRRILRAYGSESQE